MRISPWLASFALSVCFAVQAQSYRPKTIRLEGAGNLDQAQIFRILDLKAGDTLSQGQIEAALQRLAESGLFADLSYRVDDAALVFVLKPVAESQAQPVRYANFVFWQPGELEPLVEKRVPLFHGQLPLTGQLTAEVEAALTILLAEKGITGAHVAAMQSTVGDVPGVALTMTDPAVKLHQVHLEGVAPGAAAQMDKVVAELEGRDFDSAETPRTLVSGALDTHRNAGFLDAAADQPVFSAPRKTGQEYLVDATETVHPGPIYRVADVRVAGVDPKLEPEIAQATGLKVGDPAGAMTLSIASGMAARALAQHGYLEAVSRAQVAKDTSAHTMRYTFTLVPGAVYTFASIDTTTLSQTARDRFDRVFDVKPGVLADRAVTTQLVAALDSAGVLRTVAVRQSLDRSAHTVAYQLVAKTALGAN